MFCPKCGANLNNNVRFCSKCGTSISSTASRSSAAVYSSKNVTAGDSIKISPKKRNSIIAVVIVIVIIFTGIIAMFALNTSENSIKRFYRAIENQNANKMLDCVPDDFIDDLIEDYDTSKKEIRSALERYLKDDWTANYVYNDYNPGTSIDVILIYNEKVSKFDLDDVAEELEDIGFLVEDEFDPEDMKKAELYHVDFNNNDNRYQIMYTFKYKGKWYCSNALNLVEHAARLYA